MMPNYIVIKNGTIVTHDKIIYNMDILIEGDKILEIEADIDTHGCAVIDATGMYIIPGLIDMHCNICDPGYDYKEDYESVGNSAINGGFTSITCNPMTDPVIDNKAMVEYITAKSDAECLVNVLPYGSLTKQGKGIEISEIGEMHFAGVVAFSDGDQAIQDNNLMKIIFQYCSMFDAPIITHCEDIALSNNSGVNDGFISTQLGITGAPLSAETINVARNILLAEESDARLHLTHISTKKSIELIKMAKCNGLKLTVETSPQYFTLDESATLDFNSLAKVNPPLRTIEDVKAIQKAIVGGTIDVISSDHKPDTIDSKDVEFELASFGISSLETAFSLAYTKLVDSQLMSMEQLVERMSFKPAQILSLNKGKIVVGGIADLVIFNPNQSFIVDSSLFKSKANYSPYNGMKLKGLIRYTIVGGKVYETNLDAKLCEDEG